jgi:phage terminase large subunit
VPVIDLGYRSREQFVPFHRRQARFAAVVAHRRAGKTVASINDLIDAALRSDKPNPRFAYMAPYFAQAKDVAWSYLKQYTAPIPGVGVNETELRIDLPNGARIRLYGADNYDRLRGIYLDGVVLDEFADMDPRAWSEVIRPALADRKGWATFIGTPKGRNAFYDVFDRAEKSDDWFTLRLKASQTGIVAQEELDALRAEMSPDEYAREMETSFDAAVAGAYYATSLSEARTAGRITDVARDPNMQVRTYWDLGRRDATAIWIAQFIGQKINVLDYIEGAGQPPSFYFDELRTRGYRGCMVGLPHDGSRVGPENAFGRSYEDQARDAGFDVEVIRNQGQGAAMLRIDAARRLFPRIWFDAAKTEAGRNVLVAYHEKRDEKRNIGLGPEHDWASHGADAFGLMCVAYDEPRQKREAKRPQPSGSWMGM